MSDICNAYNTCYFMWLCERVNVNLAEDNDIFQVIELLDSFPFKVIVRMDANRVEDALKLRDEFSKLYFPIERNYCSVLEVLIAFACRIEHTFMERPDREENPGEWFYMMLRNLNVFPINESETAMEEVYRKIENFVERKYSPNGEGGLFYVRNPNCDMRTVDLWYQFNWYYVENEDILK